MSLTLISTFDSTQLTFDCTYQKFDDTSIPRPTTSNQELAAKAYDASITNGRNFNVVGVLVASSAVY